MNQLEIVGLRAIEYTEAMSELRAAKSALLQRMGLFDRIFNDGERVGRGAPLEEQMSVFCFDQYRAKGGARQKANNAKRRMLTAVAKHGREAK